MQPVIVYTGSIYTIAQTWITEKGLSHTQDLVAIAVGLATFMYTIQKIAEIRQRMKFQEEQTKSEEIDE